uniref:PA28_beta domain-containing protein n=1 Tax=Trichuris muris TaxID=70415 RepID=A0A5S6QRS0_TRIMR
MPLFPEQTVEEQLCELIFERFPLRAVQLYETWEMIKPKLAGNASEVNVPIPCIPTWEDENVLDWKGIIACEKVVNTRENGVDVPDPVAEHAAKSGKTKLADQIPREVRNYLADEFGEVPELDALIAMNIEEAEKLLSDELRRKLQSGQLVPPLELSPIEFAPGQPPPFEQTMYDNCSNLETVTAITPLSLSRFSKDQDCVIANTADIGETAERKPSADAISQNKCDLYADLSNTLSPTAKKIPGPENFAGLQTPPSTTLPFKEKENLDEKLSRVAERLALLSFNSNNCPNEGRDAATAAKMPDAGTPSKEPSAYDKVETKPMDPALAIDGLENEYFSHAEPVHSNMELQVIHQILRRELMAASTDCLSALLWIRVHLEHLENKGSRYYRSLQLLITTLEEKRAELMDKISKMTEFHKERANLVEDIIKYPHIEDYRLALRSYDELEYAESHRSLASLAEFYLTAFNEVLAEMEI